MAFTFSGFGELVRPFEGSKALLSALLSDVAWERTHCDIMDTYTAVVSEEDGVALDVPVDHTLSV